MSRMLARAPWGRLVAGLLMGCLAGLLVLSACSDSTSPEAPPYITGTVTDAEGLPVEGTAVLISFVPTFEDVLQPQAKASFDLPAVDTLISVRVTDPCGEAVRTLCEGEDCRSHGTLIWDGLDDDGLRVLEGVYHYVMERADTLVTVALVMIHFYADWDPAAGRAHAWTDEAGRFRVEDACLGFGQVLDITNEEGEIIDQRPLGRMVDLVFMAPDGRFAKRDSVEFPVEGDKTLEIVLPR